ncbi:molecular chaperone GroES [Porphyromonas gingivalis SJD2]|nr:molecular chaperone GroES [Porphyromonas gingivalis SJD2]OWR81244.1 molecular chaperone GroES [Porphyromonas gingivalis SJD5]
MNIKPLADRVLVKPAAAEEKTVSGIIIPDSAKEKPLKGEVIVVGNGTKDEEMVLKAGDTVLYGKYAGTEIELEGEKYIIMRQNDVLAIILGKTMVKTKKSEQGNTAGWPSKTGNPSGKGRDNNPPKKKNNK